MAAQRRRTPIQARSRATVEAILEATAQVLVREGWARTTTGRVARRAGVSIGSLYQYFPDKEALVETLAERHLERMLALAIAPLRDAPELTIPELTRRAVTGLVDAHRADPDLHRVLARQTPVDVVQRLRRAAELALAADMRHRRELGQNRVDDPEMAAFLVVTVIDEAIRAAVQDRPELLREGRLVDALTELVCGYVLPPN